MILSKKKKPAAASSVVSGEALGMDANIAMLVKERNANNAWHKLARNKTALVGFFIVAFMVVIAVFAPLIAPYDPNAINPILPFKGIGTPGHLFGTDDLGRDILSRIIYGSRISMIVAVGATIVGAIIGVLIGLAARIFRRMDRRGVHADHGRHVLLPVHPVSHDPDHRFRKRRHERHSGHRHRKRAGICPCHKRPGTDRKGRRILQRLRVVGVSPVRLLFLHILPNCVSQIIVYATLRIASAIISEASLSFLGLGIALPTASWGSILRVGRDCLTTAPHVAGTAGAFILVTVIGFNLLGDGIRDVMDPKMKQ